MRCLYDPSGSRGGSYGIRARKRDPLAHPGDFPQFLTRGGGLLIAQPTFGSLY